MDAEPINILISNLFAKAMQWGVPHLILAVLASIAAWRHRSVGMWLLAAAAAVTMIGNIWLMMMVRHSGGSPGDFRMVAFPNFLGLVLAICGWAALAFGRTQKQGNETHD